MKLYFAPGACALAAQIVLRETSQEFELVRVDLKTHLTIEGRDFHEVNPKGYVPTLELDNGEVFTEGAMILQWLADQHPEYEVIPLQGTKERYKAIEWLNYIATELHKGMGPLFASYFDDKARAHILSTVHSKLNFVNKHLEKNQYLLGSNFSVADAYLYNILRWPQFLKIDISNYRSIGTYMGRINARPSVQTSLQAEKNS